MGDLNNIFSRLNIMEQIQLNKYINAEINKKVMLASQELEKEATKKEKILEEMNDKTWKVIETSIHLAMRENRISEERINKIDARILELNQNSGEKLLIGEEQESDYKILESRDFAKMIEALLEGNCKNCHSRHSKCEVYGLLKKYNIPHSEGKGKCKYSYLKIGKKVV
jgi:hypothetical protein